MRAREFLRLILESTDEQIKSDLDVIAQAADSDPNIAKQANLGLLSILAFAKKALGINSNEQSIQEDSTTDSTIAELEKILKDYKGQMPPAVVKQINDKIDTLRNQIVAAERSATHQGFNAATGLNPNAIDITLDKVNTDISGKLSALSQIPGAMRATFVQALVNLVTTKVAKFQEIMSFLDACATPDRLIDMPGYLSRDSSGEILPPNDPNYKILKKLAEVNSGSGHSSSGQGEWMFVIAGKGTTKANPGDIEVEGIGKVEVKASSTKEGRSGLTDFTLSSGKQDAENARKFFVKTVNSTLGKEVISNKGASQGGVSSLNPKTVARLNPYFEEMNTKAPGSVQNMVRGMYAIVMPETVEVEQLKLKVDNIINSIDPTGIINLEKVSGPTAALAAAYYKWSNQHTGLMLINVPNMKYSVITDPESIQTLMGKAGLLSISSVFEFRKLPGALTFTREVPKVPKTKK